MKYETNISLAAKTTLKIGGSAAFYLQPENVADIAESVRWAGERRLPVFLLGNGSNVLISDNGWPGLVIDIGARFDRITWDGSDAVCSSGATLNRLVREMLEKKLKGLETLGGIPGTIGGALVMNAGAYGHSISECVVSIDYYDYAGSSVKSLFRDGCKAGYRSTAFSSMQAAILSGRFRFERDTSGTAREIYDDCLLRRKRKHPLDFPNCGSVFKNPKPMSAGMLIESCGLKGYRIGDVEVSTKHANFIINRGQGKAKEVRRLIVDVQKTVYEQKGIRLEPEVVFVGEFDEPLFFH